MSSMRGKVCVVTGATSGIGRVAALALAARGARVVLVCRDRAKGEAVQEAIRSAGAGPGTDLVVADLSTMAGVRSMAAGVLALHDRIHVLANNAGVYMHTRRVTVDGFEHTFALNHLAYFLGTRLLEDALVRGAPSRVVSVASEGHRIGRIDLGDLNYDRRRYSGLGAYCASKLANVLFTAELALRLDGRGVTTACMHPGAVASSWAQSDPGWWRTLLRAYRPFMRTPEKGSETLVWLATDPAVEGNGGGYWIDMKPAKPSRAARDSGLARRLWEASERLTGPGQ